MTDIIKEFNMISLLGILLPGALLTAQFGTEFDLWSNASVYFGVTLGTGLVSTILIIAGYAFGTLLHELGDLMEKLLWSSKLLSPRTYAAIRSGYAAHFAGRHEKLLKEMADKESEDEPITLRTALALALLLILRYYHYSYLKYKYSYEDQLAQELEEEAVPVNS